MLYGNYYGALDKMRPCSAAIIDWSMKLDKTIPMKRVHSRYSETIVGVKGYMEYLPWSDVSEVSWKEISRRSGQFC